MNTHKDTLEEQSRQEKNPPPKTFGRIPGRSTSPKVTPWWSRGDSNPLPPACKADALPSELLPHKNQGKALVGPGGLEPPTLRLSGVRSNHLSYGPLQKKGSGVRGQGSEKKPTHNTPMGPTNNFFPREKKNRATLFSQNRMDNSVLRIPLSWLLSVFMRLCVRQGPLRRSSTFSSPPLSLNERRLKRLARKTMQGKQIP